MTHKYVLFFLICLVCLLLQAHPYLPYGHSGIRPDLLALCVIYTGISFPLCRGAAVCFVLGYVLELVSGANSGLFVSLYIILFLIIKILKRYIITNYFYQIVIMYLLYELIKYLFFYFSFNYVFENAQPFLEEKIMKEFVYTLIFTPFLFYILNKTVKFK